VNRRFGADSQLTGAIVIDPPGAKVPAAHRPDFRDRDNGSTFRDPKGRPDFNYELDCHQWESVADSNGEAFLRGEMATVHWAFEINPSLVRIRCTSTDFTFASIAP